MRRLAGFSRTRVCPPPDVSSSYMSSILHFIGGGELRVEEAGAVVEYRLWKSGDQSTALTVGDKVAAVNPDAVAYVMDERPLNLEDYRVKPL